MRAGTCLIAILRMACFVFLAPPSLTQAHGHTSVASLHRRKAWAKRIEDTYSIWYVLIQYVTA